MTPGHPDKLADQISDRVLDSYLAEDKFSKVGCECLVTRGLVVVSGEVFSKAEIDHNKIVRKVLSEAGYSRDEDGINPNTTEIQIRLSQQSVQLRTIVESGLANDQSIVTGFATSETKENMPLAYTFSRELAQNLFWARKLHKVPYLLPDGKTQIFVNKNKGFVKISTVVVSPHHRQHTSREDLIKDMMTYVVDPVIKNTSSFKPNVYINEPGDFTIGGPAADTGLTGRKMIIDNYGPTVPHGGGAFSGKDPSKIDRTGAYFARYIAKNIVRKSNVDNVFVIIGYVKGVSQPLLFEIHVGKLDKQPRLDQKLTNHILLKAGDMSYQEIVAKFDLLRPIYSQTASWGHFGRLDLDLPWERLDFDY